MNGESLSMTETAFRTFVAALCCVILGLIFFQLRVLGPQGGYFRLVSFGIIGAVTFFMLRSRFPGFTAGAVFVLFFIEVMFYSKSLGTPRIITDGYTFAVPVASSMIFMRWFYRKPGRRIPVNPVVFGVIAGAAELLAFVVWLLALYRHWPDPRFTDILVTVIDRLRTGFVMGFGLGLGILVAEHVTLEKTGRAFRRVMGK
jgi:hypothetical protein